MRRRQTVVAAAVLGALAAGREVKSPERKAKVKRHGSVIGLRDEKGRASMAEVFRCD